MNHVKTFKCGLAIGYADAIEKIDAEIDEFIRRARVSAVDIKTDVLPAANSPQCQATLVRTLIYNIPNQKQR